MPGFRPHSQWSFALSRPLLRRWILLLSCAVGIRVTALLVFPGPNYFEGISHSYLGVAANVLQGRGIVTSVDVAPLSQPSSVQDEPFIDRPLGYVLLILPPLAIIGHPIAVQLLHILFSAFTAILMVHLGKKFGTERSAWLGAFAYALWPLSARFEIAILPDAVMPLFLVGSMALFLKSTGRRGMAFSVATGLLIGIAVTMRPDVVFLPVIYVVYLFLSQSLRESLAAGGMLILGTVGILAVHTARNYEVTEGDIMPLGLGNGISMWEGISQFGDTLGTVYGDQKMTRLEGYRSWAYPDGVERDRRRFQEAIRIIADHPVWYSTVMLRRIPVLLTPDWIMTRAFAPSFMEFIDSSPGRTLSSYISEYPGPLTIRLILVFLQYGSLFLAAFVLVVKRTELLLWLPATIILYYIGIHIPTNTEARYFYPVIPVVLLLAAQGWEILGTRFYRNHAG